MLAASAAATAVYLLLTAVALLSVVCPPLRALASHGKTRVSQNASKGEEGTLARRLWHFMVHGLTVSKRRFADFYAVGIVAILATVFATIASDASESGSAVVLLSNRQWLPTLLILAHLIRRYCECRWIQQSGASSRMHLAGYLLGIVHYLCLPFVVVPPSPHPLACTDDLESDGICNIDSGTDGVQYTTTDALTTIVCIYFQYQQHRHHVILANLRGEKSKTAYSLPVGSWFEYVSCPHYLSEIAIYVTFALLLDNAQHAAGNDNDSRDWIAQQTVKVASWLGLSGEKCIDVATAIFNARHWVLLLWVATNLAISARRTHLWYHENIVAYPRSRKRLIPFVW
ncbi:hypothetical protein ACHAXT_010365 [Thalassiosira profunda]